MRKIIGQYTTINGEIKAIYEIKGAVIKPKDIIIGSKYEVEFRLGQRFLKYIVGKLVEVTDNNRTLFFEVEDKRIGVPIMNIVNYVRK